MKKIVIRHYINSAKVGKFNFTRLILNFNQGNSNTDVRFVRAIVSIII